MGTVGANVTTSTQSEPFKPMGLSETLKAQMVARGEDSDAESGVQPLSAADSQTSDVASIVSKIFVRFPSVKH